MARCKRAGVLLRDAAPQAALRAARRVQLLAWLHDEVWSTCDILRQAMGFASRQGAERLLHAFQREGLIVRHPVPLTGKA